MSNYTPEVGALIKAGSMLANCAFNLEQIERLTLRERRSLDESRKAWDEAHSAYAATLRQQAGRVDEEFDLRKYVRHMADVLEAGVGLIKVDSDLARLGAAIQAALAQNTQGDGEAVNGLVADHLISGLGKLANTVSKRMANDIREVLSAMKPLYLHAERARVPDVECPHEWYPDTDVEVDGWFRCRLCDVSRQLPKAAPSQRAEVK